MNDIRQNSKVNFKEIKDSNLGGADVYTDDIREKVLNTGGGTFETLLSTAMGLQLSLPKVWTKSSYTNTVTLSTKLIAPSGSPRDVYDYIVDPLKYLLLLGSPTTSNGLVSGYPYLFEVVSAGNLFMKTAVVTSLTINRGGADSVFNIYRHPTSLEVRITLADVFEHFAVAYDKPLGDLTGTTTMSDMEFSLMNSNAGRSGQPKLERV